MFTAWTLKLNFTYSVLSVYRLDPKVISHDHENNNNQSSNSQPTIINNYHENMIDQTLKVEQPRQVKFEPRMKW